MRYAQRIVVGLAGVAAVALLAGSCKDSGVLAPGDGQILLSASPGTVVLDPAGGVTSGQATITAQVFDGAGFPLENVGVIFTSSSGTLASAGAAGQPPVARSTDRNGFATDVLTVTEADTAPITVTARSSTLSADIVVERSVSGGNELPTASAYANPPGDPGACDVYDPNQCQIQIGEVVEFNGTLSEDPDGSITCYRWSIDSDVDSFDEVVQGPSTSVITRTYNTTQRLRVTLRVSDDPTATTFCNPSCQGAPGTCGADESLFSPDASSFTVQIVCANDPPLANAGPNVSATRPTGGTVAVTLDGSLSSDPDGNIVAYLWNCGNGTSPSPNSGTDPVVTCTYASSGTFTATLTVRDDGDGAGANACQRQASDTATVTVTTAAP